MVNTISKITLYVNNQEEAKHFWTDKMEFVIRLEQPMGPEMKWLEVAPDEKSETVFVLYERKMMEAQNPDVSTGHPSVILSTDDIVKAYEKMQTKGIRTGEIERMPYGSMLHFYDMDGNMFLLREE